MEAITGVFNTRTLAENAVKEALKTGISPNQITLLTPGSADHVDKEIQAVPVDAAEAPGMGEAMGALAGGGVGLAGGAALMALVPGVGAITAIGLLGAAIVAAAGATIGAAAGAEAEESSYEGLPEDEIFVYEDALRKGRSVVVALPDSEHSASLLRSLLNRAGAESVDAAREQWWIGLRSAEESRYPKSGEKSGELGKTSGTFADDERFYRLGFEAALHARTRCMEFDQVSAAMNAALEEAQRENPGADVEEAFTRGYQRGREHYQQLCDETKKAA